LFFFVFRVHALRHVVSVRRRRQKDVATLNLLQAKTSSSEHNRYTFVDLWNILSLTSDFEKKIRKAVNESKRTGERDASD